jgi:hypothetical protein
MNRRHFITNTSLLTGGLAIAGSSTIAKGFAADEAPWFDKAMRGHSLLLLKMILEV